MTTYVYSTTSSTANGANWAFFFTIRPPDDGLAGARAVLGIPPGAPPDAVRRAYRARLRETHPDLGGSEEEVRRVIAAGKRLLG